MVFMNWEIEYTDDFGGWWEGLSEETQVPRADRLYDEHLVQLKKEGLIDG